jgi:hypothetical protein
MTDADIDFDAGALRSDNPVTAIFADAEITGQRFTATDGGNRLLFAGGVHTTVMPPKREAATGGAVPDAAAPEAPGAAAPADRAPE